jgi:hypothetical protein
MGKRSVDRVGISLNLTDLKIGRLQRRSISFALFLGLSIMRPRRCKFFLPLSGCFQPHARGCGFPIRKALKRVRLPYHSKRIYGSVLGPPQCGTRS